MKKMDKILKKLEDDLYMNAPYGYLSINTAGVITKVNSLFLNWTGYSADEIMDKKIREFLLIEEAEIEKLITQQKEGGLYELLLKDKSTYKVSLDVVKLKEPANNITVLRVISEENDKPENKPTTQKKKDGNLRLLNKKITYATSSVTHEIQTPLSIIKGTIDLLDDTSLTHQQKEYLDILKNSSEVLRNVMMDVIDFNNVGANTFLKEDEINVREFINGIFKMHSIIALKKNIEIKLIIDERIPTKLLGDKTKIAQVLLNLLSNAMKFTEKGIIILELEQKQVSYEGVTLLFKIKDTGIGIEEQQVNSIFKEFTQANDSIQKKYGGLGLGLSICKNILALYGSEISVKSSPKGSEFSFPLTLSFSKPSKTENPILSQIKKEVKILITDDNETNAIIVSHSLKRFGLDFEIAKNGEAAYQKVLEGGFDLVLMDMQMPVMNGITASQKIRSIENKQLNTIPIIAFSADNVLTKAELSQIGINDFLLKPFSAEDLFKKILSHLPKIKNNHTESISDHAINLDSLYKLTAGDPDDLNILIKKSLQEFEDCKTTFINTYIRNDVDKTNAIIHKLKPQMHYLKTHQLERALKEAQETMQNADVSESHSDMVLNNVVIEIDKAILAMKKFLNR